MQHTGTLNRLASYVAGDWFTAGRAGGGEELGGIRAVPHHMQRTALQGSPAVIDALIGAD